MNGGLAGVVAAETVLSDVDGNGGRLVIRGHAIGALAGLWRFEAVAALLLEGFIADASEASVTREIAEGRIAAYARWCGPFAAMLRGRDPVEAMRLLLADLGDGEVMAHPARLIGAAGTAAAMAMRAARGLDSIEPDAALTHAADLRRMMTGGAAAEAEARAFETYLVTIIDHGLNASTFAARLIASTQAGLVSSVLGALSALKGPLHGGAPGPVLDMLDAIGAPEHAEAWLAARLEAGERLMGFGHRAYRVRDPRADVLRQAIATLGAADERSSLAAAVERAALDALARSKIGRRLDVNVEFYTALLLERLGLPRAGFTAVFAAGRVAGWAAHALEQRATGRLIRPDSRYVGPQPFAEAG